MSKPALRIIDRDIEFYTASREFEESVMRRCPPAEEDRRRACVLAARAVVSALAQYREAIDACYRALESQLEP